MFTAIVMAAGQGTRMRSRLPKVLHPICGRPMVHWPVLAAQEAGAGAVVVVGGPDGALEDSLPDGVTLAVQAVPDGTGGAVRAGMGAVTSNAPVVVLSGDVPLVPAAAISALLEAHTAAGAAATTVTTVLEDPAGYGRVVRDAAGHVARVVETKAPGDATPEELEIREVNAGIYCFDAAPLRAALSRLSTDNAQGELYLPEVLGLLREDGLVVAAHLVDDPAVVLGVNDRVQLAFVAGQARQRILESTCAPA
jgi:bifunctional UDP-N-acetylglucosamine pyrophosphorylase/glucosamine-1-phosphate N-acetyltransferase